MPRVTSLDDLMPSLVNAVGGVWTADRDGSYWQSPVGDLTLQAEPFQRPSTRLIGFDCSVDERQFGRLVKHIAGWPAEDFISIRWFQHSGQVSADASLAEVAERLMREVLEMARVPALEELLEQFAAQRPDKPSIPQLCHLAALAWKANVDALLDYQQTFRRGKRLNFVAMITAEMVDRALDEALRRAPKVRAV